MPTPTTVNTINLHKVPDLQTWMENYDANNNNSSKFIKPGDVVSFPPSLLGEVLPTYPTASGTTFLKAVTTGSGTTTSWGTVDALPANPTYGDVLGVGGTQAVPVPEWQSTAEGSLITVVTSIDANSTDTTIPTAKAVWSARPSVPSAYTSMPAMNSSTGSSGSSSSYAKGDHVHPSDTSKANLASPTFTGTPCAPTAAVGTDTTQIATTAFVDAALDDKIIYSTTDLTAGTSPLATGKIYLCYEDN